MSVNDTLCIYKMQGDTFCAVDCLGTKSIICRMTTWNQRAKQRMKVLGKTQDHLAKHLGVTRGAVGHYLRGKRKPKPEQLMALAKELQCSVGWLLNNEADTTSAARRQAIAMLDSLLLNLRVEKRSDLHKDSQLRDIVIEALASHQEAYGELTEDAAAELVKLAIRLRA